MECVYSNLIPDLSIVLSFLATILKYCTLPHMMEQFAVVMSTNKFLVWWLYLFLFNLFGDTEQISIKWRLFASILATLQKDTQISFLCERRKNYWVISLIYNCLQICKVQKNCEQILIIIRVYPKVVKYGFKVYTQVTVWGCALISFVSKIVDSKSFLWLFVSLYVEHCAASFEDTWKSLVYLVYGFWLVYV